MTLQNVEKKKEEDLKKMFFRGMKRQLLYIKDLIDINDLFIKY